MNIRPFVIFILFNIILCVELQAQADMGMATYWYNKAYYNPATIIRPNYMYFYTNARHQWAGIQGAPSAFGTQVSQYFKNLNAAIGFSVVGDKIGATQALNPMFSYAYRLSNNKNWILRMGISVGLFSRTIDGSKFEADKVGDPAITYAKEKSVKPDANLGAEFQYKGFIFGIASTHLLTLGKPTDLFLNTNHRYVYGIYKNTYPGSFNFSFGIQAVNRKNFNVLETNASIQFKQKKGRKKGSKEIFDIGFSYRTTKQFSVTFGLYLSMKMKVGYAFEQSFLPGYYRNGTHEIVLLWRIPSIVASMGHQCWDNVFWMR